MRNEFLSDKRARFVAEYCLDQNGTQAAIRAGYAPGSAYSAAHRLLKNDEIRAAVAERQGAIARDLELDRQKVVAQIMEAIEVARLQADASAMIAGWREIAKMLGYYEPERRRVEVSVSSKRAVQHLETLSDAELLRLADQAGSVEAEG
jgi:phage terminase small subunit